MLQKLLLSTFIISNIFASQFSSSISKIDNDLKQNMIEGNSYSKNCPIPIDDLRYLKIKHIDFNGNDKTGELIVHETVANNIVEIFKGLYELNYPIYQMKLISKYKGDDWLSIEDNNTSAFNCRKVEGTNRWSKHTFGKAIDINPIQNPYISRKGKIYHKESLKYIQRTRKENSFENKAVLLKNDEVVKLFKKNGWKWGGDWKSIKDYQHFEFKNYK